jgi:hypothetical protein
MMLFFMLLRRSLRCWLWPPSPAIAQVTQEGEQEGESADLNQESSSTQEGDNSIQCVNDQLTGNTGNAQSLNQGISYAGDAVSPAGDATIEMIPNEDVDEVLCCDTQVNQAASASG